MHNNCIHNLKETILYLVVYVYMYTYMLKHEIIGEEVEGG